MLLFGCASVLCTYTDACLLAHLPVGTLVSERVCVSVCRRWNNEVDYELPSGVMRKNRSITRYAQEHRSTAEREERLGYKMTF